MTPDFNITIIGAGIIGLAIAAELSKSYKNIVVVEKNCKFGQETSSRNSEVIHSGIYYPTGSLKAKLCVEGRKMLYDYCEKNDIAYKKCGKLIVATNDEACPERSRREVEELDGILKQSQINGVDDGRKITKEEIKELEPYVSAVAALYFPSTGIVDSHGLMRQLQTDAINNGVEFAYNSEVVGLETEVLSPLAKGVPKGRGIENSNIQYKITVSENSETFSFTTNILINASGLQSDRIAAMIGINDSEYEVNYWKGEYFKVGNDKNKLIKRLIYPVPNKNNTGLGIHATLNLNGGLKLGPNALYMKVREEDYAVDKYNKWGFFESVSKFLPFIQEGDLSPDQAGIRPKLQKPGDPFRDFVIEEETEKGFPGFINLVGIESPGLTSCLAIGRYTKTLVTKTNTRGVI